MGSEYVVVKRQFQCNQLCGTIKIKCKDQKMLGHGIVSRMCSLAREVLKPKTIRASAVKRGSAMTIGESLFLLACWRKEMLNIWMCISISNCSIVCLKSQLPICFFPSS